MLRFAPRLSPRLVAAAARLDDERVAIAEINRRVGAVADELGLPRPSYQRVRTIVQELRRHSRRTTPRTSQVLFEIAMRSRDPEDLIRHLSGVGVRPVR